MSDLISRESLLNKINAYVVGSQDKEFICKLIKEMPSVENKGEWIDVTNGRGGHKCSICNDYAPSYQSGDEWLSKFCPNCGADMREPIGEKGDT